MRLISISMILCLALSTTGISYCQDDYEDDQPASNSSGKAVTSAVGGGLLGAGLGAAIGSANGHAGKGAAIGAGIGALGGLLMGAANEKKERERAQYERERARREEEYYNSQQARPQAVVAPATDTTKVKKRIIREYDPEGNVISEKEVTE